MKVESITLKNGEVISLNDFTLLVGPNNVGKSQTLKDINNKLIHGDPYNTNFITNITVSKPNDFDELVKDLLIDLFSTIFLKYNFKNIV